MRVKQRRSISNVLEHTNLRGLYLWRNKIGDEGVKYVVDAIANNPTIETLYLGYTDMTDEGCVLMFPVNNQRIVTKNSSAYAFGSYPSCTAFSLSLCLPPSLSLAEVPTGFLWLIRLTDYMRHARTHMCRAILLAKMLKNNNKLVTLDLRGMWTPQPETPPLIPTLQ